MKNTSALLQVFLLFIGVGIVGFYAYPEFTNISEVQDQIQEYDEAITEADRVNELLDGLVRTIENIPSNDRQALETYLPQAIDPVSVQRDIQRYTELANVELVQIGYSDVSDAADGWDSQRFELIVSGAYPDVKRLLFGIEANDYPLRLVELEMRPLDLQLIQAVVTMETYAHALEDNI